MKAFIFLGNGKFEIKNTKKPKITTNDEVLIKVRAASICGSDLHVLSIPQGQYAKPNIVLGHEFCGSIAEVGSAVKKFKIGDSVIVEPIIKCGMCEACRDGFENLCQDSEIIGQTRDGGFAEYCVVPEKYLYKIPEGVSNRLAALAEPLACVMHGILKLKPLAHERVVIFGAGAIGLIFLKVLKYYGLRNVIMCEPEEVRREEALRLGADYVVDSSQVNLSDFMETCWGCKAEIAIDAVGIGAVMEQAIPSLKIGGRLLIFGQNETQYARIKPSDINKKELTILGTMSTRDSFPAAIKLLEDKELHLEEIISDIISLEEMEQGLQLMREHKATKIVVLPEEEEVEKN